MIIKVKTSDGSIEILNVKYVTVKAAVAAYQVDGKLVGVITFANREKIYLHPHVISIQED